MSKTTNNAIATATVNTSIANTSVLDGIMNNLGYESSKLARNEEGKIEFSRTYEKDGMEITDKIAVSDESAKKFDGLAILADMDSTKPALTCVWLAFLEKQEYHKDLGYKSFGKFAVDNMKQYKNISDNMVRQYVNVGKTFFTDDTENPTFRKEWLKGVSVTVLCKMLSFYNEFCKAKFVDDDYDTDTALDLFYAEYIESGKLKLKNRTVPEVVEQLKKLAGKPTGKPNGKKGKKGDNEGDNSNDNATPLDTLITALVAYKSSPDTEPTILKHVEVLLGCIKSKQEGIE